MAEREPGVRRSRIRRSLSRIPHPHFPHLSLDKVRLFRLFALLVLFSGLVLYAVFRSPRFQDLLRRKSERLLTAATGRPVAIGGFDLSLVPPSFVVRDVSVANDPRGLPGPAFSAAEIEIRGVPSIVGRRVDLAKLRVLSPRVVFEIFADGTNNFSTIQEHLGPSSGGGYDVRLREAVIQKAALRFREWSAELDVLLQDAALYGSSEPFSRVTKATLACQRAKFLLENNQPLEFALGAEATLSPGRVHLDALRLRGDRLQIDASGGIEDTKKPVIALVAAASSTGDGLREIFGLDLPLKGAVHMRGTIRVGEAGGFRIRGRFDVPDATFGPFPLSGTGFIRVDPEGLVVDLSRADYAGGTLQALVRMQRLRNPPIPFRLDIHGRGVDFEQFFRDLGLPGTGMMGRADLDTTLTFGRGGIAHADGAGAFHLTAEPNRPSAVKGRHALPVGGGGPIFVRDGKILFPGTPFQTAGGARIRLDGSLQLDTWVPDLTLDVAAQDLAEVERIADNFYPAIQGSPLAPPLDLGGSGRLVARLTRSFGDPRVVGKFSASNFVLRDVPFGEAEGEYTVDHNVATFSPFRAASEGGHLTLTGPLGFGGGLKDNYRLDGLTASFDGWPIERIMKFLDFDLPLEGPVTGVLPLSGTTPAVRGSVPLVWRDATMWGQKIDRLEGTLSFEGDRLRASDVTATLGKGRARGGGFFVYADKGYGLSIDAVDVPLAALAEVKDAAPALSGTLTGTVAGEGTLAKPGLQASGSLAGLTWDGTFVTTGGRPVSFTAATAGGEWTAQADAPGFGRLGVTTETFGAARAVTVDLDAKSLAPWGPFLGLPVDARFDGRLALHATFRPPADTGGPYQAEGEIREGLVSVWGEAVALAEPARFRLAGNRIQFERLVLGEGPAPAGRPRSAATSLLTLSGSVGTAAPYALDVAAQGALDAKLLKAVVPHAELAGRIALDAKVGGTSGRPELSGRVRLDGVSYTPEGGGNAVEAINGSLLLSGERISTEALTMRYGGGGVDVSGSLRLDGTRLADIRLNVHLDKVRAQPFEGFRATASGDLFVMGASTIKTVRGEIVLDRAMYSQEVPLDFATLVARMRPSAATAPAPTPFDAAALEVSILAPAGSIEVRNTLARGRLSGSLFARGTFGHPILLGTLRAEEGSRLTLKDLRYQVISAQLLFSNPKEIDPFFELEARTRVKNYEITVGLSGTLARLAARFTSDPQLSEAQIVSLLATGDLPGTGIAGAPGGYAPISSDESIAKAARDVISSLATSAVTARGKDLLRLDRLQIDPGFIGSTITSPRVTIGKAIGNNFLATFTYNLSNQYQVISLEYEISPSAFLQAVRDEYGVYSVEVKLRQRLR
jgi:TamB, inner membrane protein subunit of TAM complex